VRGPILGKPTRFAELLVVYRLEGLSAAHALLLNVSGLNGRVERVQLSQKPIASLDKPPLTAQLVETLIAITQCLVEPILRVPQLTLDAAQLACQRRDLAIQ
jgi:hypothetical protein